MLKNFVIEYLKDFKMKRVNILNKQGLLTDEDRKEDLLHGCDRFRFKSCLDLSDGVQVIPYGSKTEYTVDEYSRDLSSFITWWSHFVMRDLNGFSGFSNIKFTLVGFTLTN